MLSRCPLSLRGLWDTTKIAGPLLIWKDKCVCVGGLSNHMCILYVRTHECISVCEWVVKGCLTLARLQVCLGKIFASVFIPPALQLSPIWKVEEHYYMVHLLPSSTAFRHKIPHKVYLCKMFWGGTSHTCFFSFLEGEPFLQRLGCQYNCGEYKREMSCGGEGERGKYSYGLRWITVLCQSRKEGRGVRGDEEWTRSTRATMGRGGISFALVTTHHKNTKRRKKQMKKSREGRISATPGMTEHGGVREKWVGWEMGGILGI